MWIDDFVQRHSKTKLKKKAIGEISNQGIINLSGGIYLLKDRKVKNYARLTQALILHIDVKIVYKNALYVLFMNSLL